MNPATHTRIFYKLALSQVQLGYQVSIVGRGEKHEQKMEKGVHLHHIGFFRRLALKRFFYAFYLLPKAFNIHADIYTLHSPELLGLGWFLKKFLKAKIIYDVHEDYAKNIWEASHYPRWLRQPLAGLIRKWERFSIRWVDAVSYAEACYDNVLEVKNAFVLPNTFSTAAINDEVSVSVPEHPYLLYSGTIAREWGLFEAIEIWEQWNEHQAIHLVVAGHTHQSDVMQDLLARIQQSAYSERVRLIGGRQYVPYADIIHLIQHCRMGLGLYHLLPHIQGKIPTKFYEYMAFDKPLLFPEDPVWTAFDEAHRLGIAWIEGMETKDILNQLETWEANPSTHLPASYAWDKELVKQVLESLS